MTSGYSLDDSALPLTGFHSTTACKGWRDSSLHDAPWQDAIGKQRLFELDTYGTIGAKEYYHAHVQPWLSGGYKNMSFDHFSLINPEGAARCAVEAAAQQEKHGALYVGMKDCVRSMMCDRDGGQACHSQHAHSLCLCHLSSPCLASEPSHRIHFTPQAALSGACFACHSLDRNPAFTKHLKTAACGKRSRLEDMTRDELIERGDEALRQKNNARKAMSRHKAATASLETQPLLAAAQARAAEAAHHVSACMLDIRHAAAAATQSASESELRRMEMQADTLHFEATSYYLARCRALE